MSHVATIEYSFLRGVMRMMTTWCARPLRLGLAVSALSLVAAPASAQTTTTSEFEFGIRQMSGDRSSSKFLEYRDIPEGIFLRNVRVGVDWGAVGYYATFNARDALEGDQSAQLQAGKYGRWELTVDFQETPHLFTNTGRSIYSEETPGVYTLSDQIQAELETIAATDIDPSTPGLQLDLVAFEALVDELARQVSISLFRERTQASLRVTPSPEWDLNIQYSRENQTGGRPFGTNFGFNANEQIEPTDYETHEIQGSVERKGEGWMVRAGYIGGSFRNNVSELVWDNPISAIADVESPSAGRVDLYADNSRHQGTLSAGLSLPLRGRLTSSLAYGVSTQNDPLLPFTVNDAIEGVPALPATTANAKFTTMQFNSVLTVKPARRVAVNLRYRLYDRDNEMPSLLFTDYVRTDAFLAVERRVNLPLVYARQNASADVTWRALSVLSVRGGYEWEGWERTYRDTRSTSENAFKVTADVTRGWLFLRASFRRSDRTASDYDPSRARNASIPDGTALPELAALRRFDEADRVRNRAEFIARVRPSQKFSASVSLSLADDDYGGTEYGLLKSTSLIPAVEVSVSPIPTLTFFADYAYAFDKHKMRSRQRVLVNDSPDNDWVSKIEDRVNTYGGGLFGEMLDSKLSVDLRYQRSDGEGQTNTWTPGTADLVTTATNYPGIVSDIQSFDATVRYRLSASLALGVEYRLEKYDQVDFALDPMAPFMGSVDVLSAKSTWLGVTRPDYRAYIGSLSVTWSP